MSEDEENERGSKKKGRKRTPTRRANIAPGPMYPSGTPVDPSTGLPYDNYPIDARTARQVGYDSESARVNAVMGHVQKRKAAGDTNIRFNAPEHAKYQLAVNENPGARIRFEQVEPVEDYNIPESTLGALPSLGKAIEYLKRHHWRGQRAVYKWYVYDSTNYQKAAGRIPFDVQQEEEVVQQPPGNNGQPPYPGMMPGMPGMPGFGVQGTPGFPQMPMNPWGMGMPMMPFPFAMPYQQQAAPPVAPPQQVPPQPAQGQPQMPFPYPMPAGMDPNVVNMLLALTRENAALVEETRRAAQQAQAGQQPVMTPQMMYMMMTMYPWMFPGMTAQQQQQQPKEEPKPEKPKTPIEQMKDTIGMMQTVASMGRKFATDFSPEDAEKPDPNRQEVNEDAYPYVVKEFPHWRMVVSKDGEPVDAATSVAHNLDKVQEGVRGLFKEIREGVKEFIEHKDNQVEAKSRHEQEALERKQVELKLAQEQIKQQEEALQQGERMVTLQERMARLGITPNNAPNGNAPGNVPPSPNGSGVADPQ